MWGPSMIAVAVLIGTLLDRIRLYVGAWDVAGTNTASMMEMKLSMKKVKNKTMKMD